MFYTPKHCNECGEKIERSKWAWLSIRRFCETCESELKIHDWFFRGIIGIALVFTALGIGSFLKKSEAPLNISTTSGLADASNKNQNARNLQVLANTSVHATAQKQPTNNVVLSNTLVTIADLNQQKSAPVVKQQASVAVPQNSASETVYFCGAQTKKGTPCSRRMKGKAVRCWQHEGQPAMLPPEKLIASQ
jgi:hypothetical protein